MPTINTKNTTNTSIKRDYKPKDLLKAQPLGPELNQKLNQEYFQKPAEAQINNKNLFKKNRIYKIYGLLLILVLSSFLATYINHRHAAKTIAPLAAHQLVNIPLGITLKN